MAARDVCRLPDLPGWVLAWLTARSGSPSRPFGPDDYERYLDGRPRDDGTRSFLADVVVEDLGELVPGR